MNRTQCATSAWLLQSNLVGDELLLEGLLRRGFLAYRNNQGVWLGSFNAEVFLRRKGFR